MQHKWAAFAAREIPPHHLSLSHSHTPEALDPAETMALHALSTTHAGHYRPPPPPAVALSAIASRRLPCRPCAAAAAALPGGDVVVTTKIVEFS